VHVQWQTGAFSAQHTACNSVLCNNSEHDCCHQVPQPLHSMVFWKLKPKYYILQLSSTAQEQNFRFLFCSFIRVFRTFYRVTSYHGCYAEYHIVRVASNLNIHLTFLDDFIWVWRKLWLVSVFRTLLPSGIMNWLAVLVSIAVTTDINRSKTGALSRCSRHIVLICEAHTNIRLTEWKWRLISTKLNTFINRSGSYGSEY
jgi:hypothetical protein